MKILRAPAVLLVAFLALAGCSYGSDDAGSMDETAYDMAPQEMAPMGESEGEPDSPEEREVVRTASLDLVADDTSVAADEIVALIEGAGGHVDARSETAATEHWDARAWLNLRVPAEQLTHVITQIEEFGEVRNMSVTSDDVTRYGRDLDARIGALEISTERLITLMEKADSSEALIAAEDALSHRQADLEALRSERNYLSDQVAMSTLEVSIAAKSTVEFEAGGFLGGLTSGWHSLIGFASAALVALGAVLPWLVVIGVPVAIVILLRRRRHRRAGVETQPDVTPNR